jgi:hypothetical protein
VSGGSALAETARIRETERYRADERRRIDKIAAVFLFAKAPSCLQNIG